MDNGRSVAARIPNKPMFGGGLSWITASEVATMEAARLSGIRVPKVLGWSKDHSNNVGSPYIIMEYVEDVNLHNEWRLPKTRGEPAVRLLNTVMSDCSKMVSPIYSRSGALYFKDDFPSSQPTLNHSALVNSKFPFLDSEFNIGPIADNHWWRPFHDEENLPRGPFDTVEELLLAAVTIERRAVERHREDPSSLAFMDSTLDDLDLVESLLDRVVALAPRLADCGYPTYGLRPTLLHEKLDAFNIILPERTAENELQRMMEPTLIDWQGTSILPEPFQDLVIPLVEYQPSIFQGNGEPVFNIRRTMDFDEKDEPSIPPELEAQLDTPEDREFVEGELRLAFRQFRYMEALSKTLIGIRNLRHPLAQFLPLLPQSILRACSNGPPALAATLLNIAYRWQDSWGGPCPIVFTAPEVERLLALMEKRRRYNASCHALKEFICCSPDGAVLPENYDSAVKLTHQLRKDWNEDECGGPFPLEDGRYSEHLT